MKLTRVKHLIISCLLLFNILAINAQVQLKGIDSLYYLTIDHFYRSAESAKNKIWKGMDMAPVCMYRINGPAILYNHPDPPASFVMLTDRLYIGKEEDLQLFGATQTEINGILSAINNYEGNRYASIEEAYAELFHELHHVYQRNYIKQIGFDNPAILMTYPENELNDGIKLYEQKLLYSMCVEQDSNRFQYLLNQFYSCRLKRKQIIGDYLTYEETVENMEGPALYCEYMFYNHFASFDEGIKNNLLITNNKVLTVIDNEVWHIKELILFVPEESIHIRNNRLSVNNNGKTISWSGKPELKTEKEIIFNCE